MFPTRNWFPFSRLRRSDKSTRSSTRLLFLEGFILDIDEKKRYEFELKQSRENYKNLVDKSPDGIFIFHPTDGEIIFANPSAFKIAEITCYEELQNKTILDFLLPEFRATVIERMQTSYSPETHSFREIQVKTFKNNIVEIELQAEHVQYNGKAAIQVTMHTTGAEKELVKEQFKLQLAEEANKKLQIEIDERKRAEHQLLESEERYRTIYEQAFIGIAQVCPQGMFISVNEQLCNIVGYSKEELCTKNFIDITVPEDIENSIDYQGKLIRGDMKKAVFEKKYIHKNGNVKFSANLGGRFDAAHVTFQHNVH